MVEIEVDKYYSNRGYYPYMTAQVFDALEAAYLSGGCYCACAGNGLLCYGI